MDGAENERIEVERLKQEVKESLKRRKYSGAVTSQVPEDPTQLGIDSNTLLQYADRDVNAYCPPAESQILQQPSTESTALVPSLTSKTPLAETQSSEDFEATLLMNYLDHVFPAQFSCYTPPLVELGRGWLLALLTRTKPLYHAALAMSCLSLHSILVKTRQKPSQCVRGHWEKMNRYHALAFEELQLQISVSSNAEGQVSLKENIENLACAVQLISFEVTAYP